MLNRVLQWILFLCAVSFVLNIIIYGMTGQRDWLANLLGAVVLGMVSAIGLLVTRRR